jgi:SAM-dependent methyltransferase
VLAIDKQAEAIDRLRSRPELTAALSRRLETRVSSFENADWPEPDLVNSSFALPFCAPDAFPAVWRHIVGSLRPGGRFSGQLFGDRDGWSDEREMTFLTRTRLGSLLSRLEVERLDEVEEDGTTAVGDGKHWHLFHVVARRAG